MGLKALELLKLIDLIESPDKIVNLVDLFADSEIRDLAGETADAIFHAVDSGTNPRDAILDAAEDLDRIEMEGQAAEDLKAFIAGLRKVASDKDSNGRDTNQESDSIEDKGSPHAGIESIHTQS